MLISSHIRCWVIHFATHPWHRHSVEEKNNKIFIEWYKTNAPSPAARKCTHSRNSLFHHVIINHRRNYRDRYNRLQLVLDDGDNIFVLHADHMLTVDFQQMMVDEQPVTGGRRILYDGCDATVNKRKANISNRILVHGHHPFEWSITNDHRNVIFRGIFDDFVHFVGTVAGQKVVVDLQNLVTESKAI